MSKLLDVYADVGRSAAGISLRFVRIAQDRETQRDRDALDSIVEALTQASLGEVKLQSEYPLFSSIDGLFVLVNAINEWQQHFRGSNTRERFKALADEIKEVTALEDKDERSRRADPLRGIFREAHDFAEEITVTGLRKNPVSVVFSALTKGGA